LIAWLQENRIPHVLRLREGMKVFNAAHAPSSIAQHAAHLKAGQTLALAGDWRISPSEAEASPLVRIVIMRLEPANYSRWPAAPAQNGPWLGIANAGKSNRCSAR